LYDSDDPERAVVRTLRLEPEVDSAAQRENEGDGYPRSVRPPTPGTVHRGSEVISLKELQKAQRKRSLSSAQTVRSCS
jgi:hypothetical protein